MIGQLHPLSDFSNSLALDDDDDDDYSDDMTMMLNVLVERQHDYFNM